VKDKVKSPGIWHPLKAYTQARVGLNRSGHAICTRQQLDFQWAHAQARDALHTPWKTGALRETLLAAGIETQELSTLTSNRSDYLKRPDLGRLLSKDSQHLLTAQSQVKRDIVLMVSNGLSSQAVHRHAENFIKLLLQELTLRSYQLDSIYIINNSRVALGDSVGEILKPKLGLILIGERPGLSSTDGLSLYLTYEPKLGKSDVDRNCISNIREPHGLSYSLAVKKAVYLIEESLRRRLSGVLLKDDSCVSTIGLRAPL
jgi:ethanolamine ammonia-lyase small subunit